MASRTSSLWRSLRSYQIYGANTNVGKTIISTILCKALAGKYPKENIWYLKPVSTGPLDEADNRHISRFAPAARTKCLFQFGEAVSPHIAARGCKPLPDTEIQNQILKHIKSCATNGPGTLLLETAGGVHSPTPSGTSQADLYRPLRLPILLVADHHLGGISATISAFESLHIRGYDLDAVLQFEDSTYQNHVYLRSYFQEKGILSVSIPPPPPKSENLQEDFEAMNSYYTSTSKLDQIQETIEALTQNHTSRLRDLSEMSTKAHQTIWYPFTQQKSLSPSKILTIDSAYGDFFQTTTPSQEPQQEQEEQENILTPTFDGSASWWTQGLGHGSPSLTLAAAHASGRYGHTIFASTIHPPALFLSSLLLSRLKNPRLSRVFFSDNGSTGMEVAIKMALTASWKRYGDEWTNKGIKKGEVGVLGLKGSYHGDTIGAMDMSEPGVFNERVPWYKGRGWWFEFPRVKCQRGEWVVEIPDELRGSLGEGEVFEDLNGIFDLERRVETGAGRRYRRYVEETLERLVKKEGKVFGALAMEPVILGAGGMLFADPLFQHILATTIRSSPHLFYSSPHLFYSSPHLFYSSPPSPKTWSGLPVLHDEVFTGLHRLGPFSSSSYLNLHPDISVHAKLLTGGLLPLCTTLASESIYEAFLGEEKRDALLHGHSYTAHPVGCAVACESLRGMERLEGCGEWDGFKTDWGADAAPSIQVQGVGDSKMREESTREKTKAWSMWSNSFVTTISYSESVESVIALGTVLAINLQDKDAGYSSSAATGLQKRLLEGCDDFKIHVRVLGNVLYLLASLTSKRETLAKIEALLLKELA